MRYIAIKYNDPPHWSTTNVARSYLLSSSHLICDIRKVLGPSIKFHDSYRKIVLMEVPLTIDQIKALVLPHPFQFCEISYDAFQLRDFTITINSTP